AVSRELIQQPEYGAAPFRKSHRGDRLLKEGWLSYGLGEAQTARLIEVLKTYSDPPVANPALRLRIPDQRDYERILHAAIRQALETGNDPAATLAAVKSKWKELDEKKGLEKCKQEFRRSLGL